MKKLLSFILVIAVLISAVAVFSLNTAAASTGVLTVTSNGETLGTVEVGNEFIFRVSVNTSGYSVNGGQGEIFTNPKYAKVVAYGETNPDGSVYMDSYAFPKRIRNSSLVTNYDAANNRILYNFSKGISGVGAFDITDHYFKLRFQAVAPGKVEIRHYFKSLSSVTNNRIVRLINDNKGNSQISPTPYSVLSIEAATALVGDADGDRNVTVMDATFIQRVTAGVKASYRIENTDVNNDGEVNLRDALNILRYKAGISTNTKTGEWIFPSEE